MSTQSKCNRINWYFRNCIQLHCSRGGIKFIKLIDNIVSIEVKSNLSMYCNFLWNSKISISSWLLSIINKSIISIKNWYRSVWLNMSDYVTEIQSFKYRKSVVKCKLIIYFLSNFLINNLPPRNRQNRKMVEDIIKIIRKPVFWVLKFFWNCCCFPDNS